MNIVKYYRKRLDGVVEIAEVKINNRQDRKFIPGGRVLWVRHRLPCVRIADREMLRRGFTRTKLKPDVLTTPVSKMARAIAALGLAPLR